MPPTLATKERKNESAFLHLQSSSLAQVYEQKHQGTYEINGLF